MTASAAFKAPVRIRGAEATTGAPLAWLRLEPVGPEAALRLTIWPGGTHATLATCGFHGQTVRWLGPWRGGGMRQPPFQERRWVLDDAQQAARGGAELDCPLCDGRVHQPAFAVVSLLFRRRFAVVSTGGHFRSRGPELVL